MIYTEWSTANIFHRIRSKINNTHRNVMYYDSDSIYDSIIKSIDTNLVFVNHNNPSVIDHSFDYTIMNSVFISSEDLTKAHNTNTKLIILNHADLSNTKREDVHILNQNLKDTHIINFDRKSDNVLNSYNINYAIPTPECNKEKTKDLLIINLNKNPLLDNMYNFFVQNKYSAQMLTSIKANIQDIYKVFSQYKVVIDISSRLNAICAMMCKCNVVSQLDLSIYPESKHIIKLKEYETIKDTVDQALLKPAPDTTDISKTYQTQPLIDTIKEISNASY